jgi:uncharacterized membrane protein
MNDLITNVPMILLLKTLMNLLDLTGVAIIVVGALHALGRYFLGLMGRLPTIGVDQMRLDLGRNIVLAVEFLLAADIVKTIVTPDYYEIGMLGALVIIRTVLTYFLNQELSQLQNVH